MNGVLQFVGAHPYLFANLPIVAMTLLLPRLVANRDYGRAAMFSGLACLPCALAELTSLDYWRPVLLGGAHWGLESVIFTYASGASVWLVAALWSRQSCAIGVASFREGFRRLTPWALAGTGAYWGLWWAGMNCVTATLLTSAGLLLFQLRQRADLWRLALAGCVLFMPVYVLGIRIQFAVWPHYLDYWLPGGLWGTLVLGVPRGEVAWAILYGATYPVVMASALDMRFSSRRLEERSLATS